MTTTDATAPEHPPRTPPAKVCDLVMKGGITSGVVYPLALVELAKTHHFASIGGTSAGAMAAAAAAAAEYGRPTGGFERLERVPQDLGAGLLGLFPPTPKLRPLLDIGLAAMKAKGTACEYVAPVCAAVKGYPLATALGALPGLALLSIAYLSDAGAWGFALALLVMVLGALGWLARRVVTAITEDLPAADFGICPGIRQDPRGGPGFMDWLADLLDETAGLGSPGHTAAVPLTFGHLAKPPGGRPPITLAMMTTNLSMKRPHRLPFETNVFLWSEAEFRRILPKRIVDHMVATSNPAPGEPGDLRWLPSEKNFPVAAAVRMSLSFPGLIPCVPLWACDHTFSKKASRQIPRRCLFSDGGLSSNFPIHFFDQLWPTHPTFGISLDEKLPGRGNCGARNGSPDEDDRVDMPDKAGDGILLPVRQIDGIFGFLMRLVDTAKDWQDTLQSTLPGYRDRIVRVALAPDEGGLNLDMDEAKITRLSGYGRAAAEKVAKTFDFDRHRRTRFLVAMARVEETFDDMATAYDPPPAGAASPHEPWRDFLARQKLYEPPYEQTKGVAAVLVTRAADIAAAGRRWRADPLRKDDIPKPKTNLRITPEP